MSRKQNGVLITAPLFGTGQEREVFEGYPCGYCHSKGYFSRDSEEGQWEKYPCPKCGGTGKVKAVVTIDWQPDGEVKPFLKQVE